MTAETTHTPCCSAHGRDMTCRNYRRTHFVEVRPCCAADALVYEGEEAEKAKALAALDLTPVPAEEVWARTEDFEGLHFIHLGEDGELAIAPGHDVDPALFARALADYVGDDPENYDDQDATWLVARRHAPDCRQDLEPDENCGCGQDWDWWGSFVDEGTPGAIAVTRWSA